MRGKGRTILMLLLATALLFSGAAQAADIEVIGGADGPTAVYVADGVKETEAPIDETDEETPTGGDAAADDAAAVPVDDAATAPASGADTWNRSELQAKRTAFEQTAVEAAEKARFDALHTPLASQFLTIDAQVGYDRIATLSKTIPITVTLNNSGPDLDGAVCLNLYRGGNEYDRVEYPAYLGAGASKQLVMPIELGVVQGIFTIEYCVGNEVIASVNASPRELLDPTVRLIGTLARAPRALSYMTISSANDVLMRRDYFRTIDFSPDTFPASRSMMDAFSVFVVDGADLRALSPEKREALDGWLRAGGVVIVGGGAQAATNYPFFETYTGVSAGALSDGGDITGALMSAVRVSEKALGKGVQVNELIGGSPIVRTEDGRALIAADAVDSGKVFTCAFELGAKPLTDWQGIGTYVQQLLLQYAPEWYARQYGGGGNGHPGYFEAELLNQLERQPIPVDADLKPAMLLLAAYLLLAGVLAYLVLKRLDRRAWLWWIMPGLAAACVGGVWLMSRTSVATMPLAASSTCVTISQSGAVTQRTYAGVARADGGSARLAEESGARLVPADSSGGYFGDPGDQQGRMTPATLKYRRIEGDNPSIVFPASPPWTMNAVRVEKVPEPMNIDASIWVVEDGMNAKFVNNGDATLLDCVMLTSLGYARVGDLAPGQTIEVALTAMTDAETQAVTQSLSGSTEPYYPAGRMISQLNASNYGSISIYNFVGAALDPFYDIKDEKAREKAYFAQSEWERNRRAIRENLLQQSINNGWRNGSMTADEFHLIGFSEDLGKIGLMIDDQRIVNAAHMAVVDIAMRFEPIGPTGVVYYPAGLLPAFTAKQEGDGAPVMGERAKDNYYQLSAQPIFAFQIPDVQKITVKEINTGAQYYASGQLVAALYNHETAAWDGQKLLSISLKEDAAKPYIGVDGTIFVKYVPGGNADAYADVSVPTLRLAGTMEGGKASD